MSDYGEEWDELDDENPQKDPNVFELGHCLKAPTARSYTTKELHGEYPYRVRGPYILILQHYKGLIHEGVIDLNPPYQRGAYPVVTVPPSRLSSSQRLFGQKRSRAGS